MKVKKERLLNRLSKVLLILGLLGGIAQFWYSYEIPRNLGFDGDSRRMIQLLITGHSLGTMLISYVIYAFLQVVIQISLTLKGLTSLDEV